MAEESPQVPGAGPPQIQGGGREPRGEGPHAQDILGRRVLGSGNQEGRQRERSLDEIYD